MIKSKSIEILRTFSDEEFRMFGKFVNSPFHNHNKNLRKLYLYLKMFFPLFEDKNFNKENLHKSLFPNKKFRDEKIRELMSDLFKVEQSYLIITGFTKRPMESEIVFLNELNIRGIDKLYKVVINSIGKNASVKNRLNEDIYRNLMNLYEEKISFNLIRGKIDNVYGDVLEKRENLITYFLIRLFKSTQDLIQIERTQKDRTKIILAEKLIDSVDFESFFDNLKNSKDKAHKILEMYYNMMMTYLKKEDAYYYKFKNLIVENIDFFTSGEIYDMLVSLNNCSQYLINLGKPEFLKEFLFAYKFMLSKGIYKPEDSPYLSAFDFRNIIGAATQQKEFDWTEEFMKKYVDKLDPVQKDNLVNYSKALLSYYRNDFESSLTFLSGVKDINIVFKIDIRTLLVRIYFDLNAHEEFFSLTGAFKQMINKSDILDEKRKLHIVNFIKFAIQLFKIKIEGDKEKLLVTKNIILKNNQTSIKFWLIDKIEELERIL